MHGLAFGFRDLGFRGRKLRADGSDSAVARVCAMSLTVQRNEALKQSQ